LPARSTVMLLADPTTHRESRPALERTASALGLALRETNVGTPDQIEKALREAKDGAIAGVNVLSSAVLGCPRLSSAVLGCPRLSSAVLGCPRLSCSPCAYAL
jgi:hypothetical protein